MFEALESRTLLTILIKPFFGPETQTQNGGGEMSMPPINLIFWGSFWGGPAGNARSQAVIDAVSQLTAFPQPYFQVVNQYGANSADMYLNDSVFNNTNPPAVIGTGDVDSIIQGQIDNHHLPESDDGPNPPIYIVVTQPGTTSPGAVGFNTAGSDFDLGLPPDFDTIPEVWVSTKADSSALGFDLDLCSSVISHEVGESMSDFNGGGVEFSPPAGFGAKTGLTTGAQIGDNEGSFYRFRLTNGVLVQPLWSAANQAWVVDDGTLQQFELSPNWNTADPAHPQFLGDFTLTIQGDQMTFPEDTLSLDNTPSGGIAVTLNGETVEFDPGVLSHITVDLGAGDNTVNMNIDPFTSNGGSALGFEMKASGGQIELHGPNLPAKWIIDGADRVVYTTGSNVSGFQINDVADIFGGNAGNRFQFLAGGSLSGGFDGGSAAGNIIDLAAFTEQANVYLQFPNLTPINGTFHNIQTIVGGQNPLDTLVGPDADSTWQITGLNSGMVAGYTFLNFPNLAGGSGKDTFSFLTAGPITGNIDGGSGTNTLDYSQLAGPVTVNLKTGTASGIGGTFANIQNVIGSQSPNDTIIGPDALWTIDGPDSGSVYNAPTGTTVTFSSFENLQGNIQADTFAFKPGGSITGNLDGGGGVNTLDFSALTTPVTINFAAHSIPGLVGGTFGNIGNIVTGPGGLSVVGPDTPTTWTITGVNTVNALGFTFTNTPSITGGSSDDTFDFLPGARLDGTLDGGGGNNTLDDSQVPTDVVVDLAAHYAIGVGQEIFNVQNVIGGKANNLLVGDAGANTLTGGAGRNVLIGDGGPDLLVGGSGDNILIGDSTIWDTNLTALMAIFAEWTRLDQSFEKRISDLINNGGQGLNGSYTLSKKTVMSDNAPDVLVGGLGRNWFFQTKRRDILFGEDDDKDRVTTL